MLLLINADRCSDMWTDDNQTASQSMLPGEYAPNRPLFRRQSNLVLMKNPNSYDCRACQATEERNSLIILPLSLYEIWHIGIVEVWKSRIGFGKRENVGEFSSRFRKHFLCVACVLSPRLVSDSTILSVRRQWELCHVLGWGRLYRHPAQVFSNHFHY